MYIGAATGGVWKSTDNGTTWSPTTDDRGSLAIGAIAIDPNKSSRIFAGTGEYHPADEGASVYYGNGLLLSEQGGQPGSWKELAASQFERDEITRVLFDPTNDATSQRMFLSSATGVYESTNGGAFWQLLRAGSASDLVAIFNPGSPPTVQLIAAFYGEGLYTSTRTGSTWSAWAQIESNAYPASFGRIALGQCRDVPQTIWAAFSAGAGGTIAGLAKTDTGGASWVSVPWTPQLPYPSLAYNYQTWYNLLIAVHPKDPDIVYLGEVQLWKKPKGSGSWAHISADDPATPPPYHAIHVDQH
ncbi:MAG: hypothetical protein HYY85_22555, partial [Deltaproteobacteria bacterium]|nr:hypothetical protein [Deltaproteobacteria bacterium]